jgi:hypothetical protein
LIFRVPKSQTTVEPDGLHGAPTRTMSILLVICERSTVILTPVTVPLPQVTTPIGMSVLPSLPTLVDRLSPYSRKYGSRPRFGARPPPDCDGVTDGGSGGPDVGSRGSGVADGGGDDGEGDVEVDGFGGRKVVFDSTMAKAQSTTSAVDANVVRAMRRRRNARRAW